MGFIQLLSEIQPTSKNTDDYPAGVVRFEDQAILEWVALTTSHR